MEDDIKPGQVIGFSDKAHRERYSENLANIISEAMRHDAEIRLSAITEGRVGLGEMMDADLISLGVECWNLFP